MASVFKLCLVAGAGVASHLLVFIRGEHHVQAPRIFRLYLLLLTILSIAQLIVSKGDHWAALNTTSSIFGVYTLSLLSSMTVYRTFFHSLHCFPGPFMAKISKFWHVSKCLRAKNHILMQRMHENYGDFVRTGPNELTIFKAEAVHALDGASTECSKSPWYDLLIPRVSVATTRDKFMHDQRRRVWNKAFSVTGIQAYESQLIEYAQLLDQKIASSNGKAMEVSRCFYLYTFDIMGRIAFGKTFNMLTSDENHFAVDLLQDGMTFLGPFSPTPWLARIGYSIPGVAQCWKNLLRWSRQQASEIVKAEVGSDDSHYLFSLLLDASQKGNEVAGDTNWLGGDSFAAVIAGSDTIASTLTFLFYHLCHDPSQIAKLRTELESIDSIFNTAALRQLPHLNGVISETMRLHPALPTGGLRDTPPQGITIAGVYIPGNITVSAPRYVLGRSEKSYEKPLEFIPERWYSMPHMVKDKTGFSPFCMGRHTCVGRNLSMKQMTSVVALLVTKYDISFALGEDGFSVCNDMKDQFNQHPGKLHLCFTSRVSGQKVERGSDSDAGAL